MAILKKLNNRTIDEAHKKELVIKRLKHNEVNIEVTFQGPSQWEPIFAIELACLLCVCVCACLDAWVQ